MIEQLSMKAHGHLWSPLVLMGLEVDQALEVNAGNGPGRCLCESWKGAVI